MKTKTVMVLQSHACGAECACGKNKRPQQASLTQQVEAELKKHPDVIATVNEATGEVLTFIAPKTQAASFRSLPPDEQRALEAERKRLLQRLPLLTFRDRTLAERRIREIQRTLDVGRFDDESARRHQERREERRREGVGQ